MNILWLSDEATKGCSLLDDRSNGFADVGASQAQGQGAKLRDESQDVRRGFDGRCLKRWGSGAGS